VSEGSVLGGDARAGFFAHFALARAQVGVISAGEAEVSAVILGPSESRSDGFGSSNRVLEPRGIAAASSRYSILLEVPVALFADTAESRSDGSGTSYAHFGVASTSWEVRTEGVAVICALRLRPS